MGSAPVEGDRANPARALAGRIPPTRRCKAAEENLTLGFLAAEGLLRLFARAETTEVSVKAMYRRVGRSREAMVIKKFFEKLAEAAVE
jgi:hypothetical protein